MLEAEGRGEGWSVRGGKNNKRIARRKLDRRVSFEIIIVCQSEDVGAGCETTAAQEKQPEP